MQLFNESYRGRKVLVTGHTGFKGSWLVSWLEMMGAEVTGFSLKPQTNPTHYDMINMKGKSIIGDINDGDMLKKVLEDAQPEIVFHLAAQPIVRLSYEKPVETYKTNVIGTLNVLEAIRFCGSVKAVVAITTDKVYKNNEWEWGYREVDRLGGYDPYSSSKACAEILIDSYRNSFWNLDEYKKSHNVLLASARAGNVIGGGDWAMDRLVPDIVKSAALGETVIIRSPNSTRPWQHVLECLSGYLLLGQSLLEESTQNASAYNFGPEDDSVLSVLEMIKKMQQHWDAVEYKIDPKGANLHEAKLLQLTSCKAKSELKWDSVWESSKAFEVTMEWYREYYNCGEINTGKDIEKFVYDARNKGLLWAQ